MSLEELKTLNPSLGEKMTIYIGEELNVTQQVPFLEVVSTKEE